MSRSVAEEKREEFLNLFGKEYCDADYAEPSCVDPLKLSVVRAIKLADAFTRQTDLNWEISNLPKIGDAVNIPKEKNYLLTEFEVQKDIIAKWDTK